MCHDNICWRFEINGKNGERSRLEPFVWVQHNIHPRKVGINGGVAVHVLQGNNPGGNSLVKELETALCR